MTERCVFLDRDNTLIEDPGYLSDPSAVRLLPGVETALASLAKAGFKLVVVSNQSAIARGLLTEEGLEHIHAEMRRQLGERGVRLDGIYYCPYHPEATVERYARESPDRKPQPGMLLRAGSELGIDLTQSWMIGDSPRDIEAGQRAGCRTIRVRLPGEETADGQTKRDSADQGLAADEDAQADFTVRNLVDAARVILKESGAGATSAAGESAGAVETSTAPRSGMSPAAAGAPPSDSELLQEIVRLLRRREIGGGEEEFSLSRLAGAIFQIFALLALLVGIIYIPSATGTPGTDKAYGAWVVSNLSLLAAVALQLMALTFLLLSRKR